MLHKGGDIKIIDVSKNQQYILLPELTYKFPGKNSGNDTKRKLLEIANNKAPRLFFSPTTESKFCRQAFAVCTEK